MRFLIGLFFSTGKDKERLEIDAPKNKWQCVMAWIVIILSLIFSITALCREHPRVLCVDYMGVIIGALSILVAFLVGWNIYSALDINKRVKVVEENAKKREIFADAETHVLVANTLMSYKREIEALYRIIKALTLYAQVQDYRGDVQKEIKLGISNCVSILLNGKGYSSLESIKVSDDRKQYIKIQNCHEEALPKFNDPDCDKYYNAVIKIIYKIEKNLDNECVLKQMNEIWSELEQIRIYFNNE